MKPKKLYTRLRQKNSPQARRTAGPPARRRDAPRDLLCKHSSIFVFKNPLASEFIEGAGFQQLAVLFTAVVAELQRNVFRRDAADDDGLVAAAYAISAWGATVWMPLPNATSIWDSSDIGLPFIFSME